ncbi:hypothetical protein QBC44DRAFT_23088 [Cladorrhinum sp. PSN332]|nr:hypothetical protein QBC44DRAFT_23088 [Cladorrhinum sp. PSN332]
MTKVTTAFLCSVSFFFFSIFFLLSFGYCLSGDFGFIIGHEGEPFFFTLWTRDIIMTALYSRKKERRGWTYIWQHMKRHKDNSH